MQGNDNNEDEALERALSAAARAHGTAWVAYTDARRAHERLERYCEQRWSHVAEATKEASDEC